MGGGNLLCFIILGYRKKLNKRRGGVSRFSVGNFCLTVPNISVGEAFSVAIDSGVEKIWIRVGGREGVSRFSV